MLIIFYETILLFLINNLINIIISFLSIFIGIMIIELITTENAYEGHRFSDFEFHFNNIFCPN